MLLRKKQQCHCILRIKMQLQIKFINQEHPPFHRVYHYEPYLEDIHNFIVHSVQCPVHTFHLAVYSVINYFRQPQKSSASLIITFFSVKCLVPQVICSVLNQMGQPQMSGFSDFPKQTRGLENLSEGFSPALG